MSQQVGYIICRIPTKNKSIKVADIIFMISK